MGDHMKKKSNIGWWIAGLAGVVLLHNKLNGVGKRGLLFPEEETNESIEGIGAAKKFYVYAGYYENYISSKPMPRPYVLRKTFRSIDRAINYAESFGDTVIYCDNVKYNLPDFMYDAIAETDGFFKY